jgi:hypothetical protein
MKKINIKLGNLQILNLGLAQLSQLNIKSKTSWNITRILKKIIKEIEICDKERVKLCEKYATKDEQNQPIIIKIKEAEQKEISQYDISDENKIEFENELNELLKQEVEIEINPITIDDLPEIKPSLLMIIEDLIDDGENQQVK